MSVRLHRSFDALEDARRVHRRPRARIWGVKLSSFLLYRFSSINDLAKLTPFSIGVMCSLLCTRCVFRQSGRAVRCQRTRLDAQDAAADGGFEASARFRDCRGRHRQDDRQRYQLQRHLSFAHCSVAGPIRSVVVASYAPAVLLDRLALRPRPPAVTGYASRTPAPSRSRIRQRQRGRRLAGGLQLRSLPPDRRFCRGGIAAGRIFRRRRP